MSTLIVALLLALVAAPAAAQHATLPDPVRAAADRITAEQLGRDLEYLASDERLGRDTGSPGFDAAALYITRRLEQAGLTPLGDAGTFRQHYDLVESRLIADEAYLQVGDRRVHFGDGFVMRSLAGAVTATAPVVYVGHGWYAPDRGIDPYARVDVRGAFVLAHGPQAMPKDVTIQQIGRVAVGASAVFAEAAARGALGVMFIPPARTLTDWATLREAHVLQRELDPRVPSAYAALPVTSITLAPSATSALMEGEAITGEALGTRGEAADYPPSFRLAREVTLHVPTTTSRSRPYNLVAMIEGSDQVLKHEYITVESHLDGAVGVEDVDGDRIYNSADDNATGSAATLSIAEQMMKAPRPRRSLIFIWDSGEERGLWGTRHFVHQPPVPLDRIVAHVNVDMIGANRAPGSADADSPNVTGPNEVFLIGPGVLSTRVDALLEDVNRAYLGMEFNRRDDRPDSEFFYPRTDAGPFLERGILTIGFTTGTHARYHLPADEAQYLDPRKMETITRTIFASLWMLASTDERPGIDRDIPAIVPRYR
jgi:Zn-dependent M28 family amino/carboxypeptidase